MRLVGSICYLHRSLHRRQIKAGRHGAMRMIPRVTRGVRITCNEWMKQALLDGIDQSQSTLFPDYRQIPLAEIESVK